MKTRRRFLLTLTSAAVALTMVVGPAIAAELLGIMSKVDVDGKKITVMEKGSDKEVVISVTDDTELITAKGSSKVDLEKLAKFVDRAKEKGRPGIGVRVTHENNIASKIEVKAKKKGAPKGER